MDVSKTKGRIPEELIFEGLYALVAEQLLFFMEKLY